MTFECIKLSNTEWMWLLHRQKERKHHSGGNLVGKGDEVQWRDVPKLQVWILPTFHLLFCVLQKKVRG